MKYVYLVRAGEGNYKVGVASNILNRVRALQTSNSQLVEVVAAKQTPNAHKLEKGIHDRLAKLRHNGGREWFNLTPEEAIKVAIKINQSPAISVSEVQALADMITEQNELQSKMASKMQTLLDQARSESIIPKPKIKVIKELVESTKTLSEDEILLQAREVILKEGKASTSMLQRNMRIGYGRASRIIETLEKQGFISEADGSRPRYVKGESFDMAKTIASDMITA